ncbi:MAG: hypothetical protein LBU18_02375 [Treponema sp.]|nr:hypothetical protein [Treponema sp.]
MYPFAYFDMSAFVFRPDKGSVIGDQDASLNYYLRPILKWRFRFHVGAKGSGAGCVRAVFRDVVIYTVRHGEAL